MRINASIKCSLESSAEDFRWDMAARGEGAFQASPESTTMMSAVLYPIQKILEILLRL
jgi:hypothetical protein